MALASAPGDTVLLPSLAPPEKMSAVDTSVATQTKPPDAAPGDGTDDELALTRALAAELEARSPFCQRSLHRHCSLTSATLRRRTSLQLCATCY